MPEMPLLDRLHIIAASWLLIAVNVLASARCLCSSRWLQAQRAGRAPPVVLESTHRKALEVVPLELLMEHSANPASSDAHGSATVPAEAEAPPKSEL